ncbi:MAG: peptidylprolyl isomerase [Steroidobacteraceae bacterium]
MATILTFLACPPPALPQAAATKPAAKPAEPAPAHARVILHTTLGDIHIELETARAPVTSRNFLAYVDSQRFDGIKFYRALKANDYSNDGLVQAGLQGNIRNAFPPIAHESTVITGLSHVDGAVSMARGSAVGSARADFFIIVGGMPHYDGVPNGGDPGYAVFGRVVSGMSVARRIMRLPRAKDASNPRMQGQMLAEPVTIISARRAP